MSTVAEVRKAWTPDIWRFFAEFCAYEKAAGGPDPHMATIIEMGRELKPEQRLWLIGCYVAVYNVPAAEFLYQLLPDPATAPWAWKEGALEDLLRQNWTAIPTRRERRAVRNREQMAHYLIDYRNWMLEHPGLFWEQGVPGYLRAWDEVQKIYSIGRYMALKLLECLRRVGYRIELPDLRAPGGWSPKEGLALLWDVYADRLMEKENGDQNRLANQLAEITRSKLRDEHNVILDRYETQVLLCDFKQSWMGMRQYPGRSLDSELEYARVVNEHDPGFPFAMFRIRDRLFPVSCLGEWSGWTGVRKELGTVARQQGYTWSDLKYVYSEGMDLAHPKAA